MFRNGIEGFHSVGWQNSTVAVDSVAVEAVLRYSAASDGRRVRMTGGNDGRRLQLQLLSLDLGAVVLEPQLDVLGLERREALPVRGAVQLVRVLFDGVGGRVGVVGEPALEARYLRQRVDEHTTSLAPVHARTDTYTWPAAVRHVILLNTTYSSYITFDNGEGYAI